MKNLFYINSIVYKKITKASQDYWNINSIQLRTGRKATIITTNLGFDRWDEIFGDPVLTAALVDRLTHKAYLINMSGESYRMKETKKMMTK